MPTWAKHVDGVVTLVREPTPICDGKGGGQAGESRGEVVLPCSYGAFGGISAVHIGRGVLKVGVLGGNEGFNVMRRLVIHFVEARFEAPGGEIIVSDLVGAKEFFFRPILDGNGSDEVGIVDIEDDQVSVAAVGRDGETSSLIGEYPTGGVGECHEDEMGVVYCAGRRNTFILGVIVGVDEDNGGVAARGRALALASLIHVPLFSCIVDRDMPADPGGCEPGKAFKITPIDSLE